MEPHRRRFSLNFIINLTRDGHFDLMTNTNRYHRIDTKFKK